MQVLNVLHSLESRQYIKPLYFQLPRGADSCDFRGPPLGGTGGGTLTGADVCGVWGPPPAPRSFNTDGYEGGEKAGGEVAEVAGGDEGKDGLGGESGCPDRRIVNRH